MIYSEFGSLVSIVSYHGKQAISEGYEGHLLTVGLTGPVTNHTFYGFRFAEFLKADKGWNEIYSVIEKMEITELATDDLKEAIKEAL